MKPNNSTAIIFVAGCMVFSFFLCTLGLRFGLPSKKQTDLLYNNYDEARALMPYMASRRNDIYEGYATQDVLHSYQNIIPKGKNVTVRMPGRTITLPEERLDILRTFHLQSQLPDENHTLKVVYSIKWKELDFNPRFFVYGGMFIYPIGISLKLCSMLGFVTLTNAIPFYLENPGEAALLFVIPKVWSAVVFVLSIPFFYIVGRNLYNRKTGLIATALYAFAPISITYCHFLKPHAPALLWIVLCMWASTKLLRSDNIIWCMLAGIFAGFAGGMFVYSGAIILFSLGAYFAKYYSAIWRKGFTYPQSISFFSLIVFMIIGFVMVNPYWVIDYKDAWREIFMLGRRGVSIYHLSVRGFAAYAFHTIPEGVGYAAGVLFWAGALMFLARPDLSTGILLFLAVPFTLYASGANADWWHSNLHMSMAIVPAILLIAANSFVRIFTWNKLKNPGSVLAVLIIFITGLNAFYYDMIFMGGDNKIVAGKWINDNIRPNATIGAQAVMNSGYRGYPPFRLLEYNEAVTPFDKAGTDYYVVVGDAGVNPEYAVEKVFKRKIFLLDYIFSNKLIPFADADVTIYRKIK